MEGAGGGHGRGGGGGGGKRLMHAWPSAAQRETVVWYSESLTVDTQIQDTQGGTKQKNVIELFLKIP